MCLLQNFLFVQTTGCIWMAPGKIKDVTMSHWMKNVFQNISTWILYQILIKIWSWLESLSSIQNYFKTILVLLESPNPVIYNISYLMNAIHFWKHLLKLASKPKKGFALYCHLRYLIIIDNNNKQQQATYKR